MSDLRRCWAPKLTRSAVSQPLGRESLDEATLVCPQFGDLTVLLFPYADSQMMPLLRERVVTDLPDYFMAMLVDHAK
jgi:hypothetical protein